MFQVFPSGGAVSITIDANKIGADSAGNNPVANSGDGISIGTNSSNTTISNNVISGNIGNGINVLSDATEQRMFMEIKLVWLKT